MNGIDNKTEDKEMLVLVQSESIEFYSYLPWQTFLKIQKLSTMPGYEVQFCAVITTGTLSSSSIVDTLAGEYVSSSWNIDQVVKNEYHGVE